MSLCIKFNEEKVHSHYPEASMIPAMKIWQLPKHKRDNLEEYCNSGDYLASLKKDGYFYMLNRTPQFVYLFSRSPSVKTGLLTEKIFNVPHIEEAALALPADTLLAGEIFIPGKTSKAVTRIMGSLPEKAVRRQADEGLVHYYIFDVIMFNGKSCLDMPFEERATLVEEIYENYFSDYDYIEYAKQVDTDICETIAGWLAEGEEGAVLRKKNFPYQPDKRPAWSSIKVKQENSFDVIITGFNDPTKEYDGTELDSWKYWVIEKDLKLSKDGTSTWVEKERWIGEHKAIRSPEFRTIPVTKAYYYGWKNRIEISAYNADGELTKIGTISSGLTDELREAFAKSPENYLGRVIEIKCMSVDSEEHTIRHGFLQRFRDDKNPEDCTFDTIFS